MHNSDFRGVLRGGALASVLLGLAACSAEGTGDADGGDLSSSLPTASTDASGTSLERFSELLESTADGEGTASRIADYPALGIDVSDADVAPATTSSAVVPVTPSASVTAEPAPAAAAPLIDVAPVATVTTPVIDVEPVDEPAPVAEATIADVAESAFEPLPAPAEASAPEPVAEIEPVVEPAPEPVSEPAPESTPAPVEVAEVESKPEPEPEPVAEAEPVVEPVAEAEPAAEPESAAALPAEERYRVRISWNAAADTDLGYYVYYGESSDSVDTFARRIPLDDGDNGGVMSATLDAPGDLTMGGGSRLCFAISAWNSVGETERSAVRCADKPA